MGERVKDPKFLLITGMSGAGRSSTLDILEDMGFEAVDNLPVALLSDFMEMKKTKKRPVAVGVDIRTRGFNAEKLVKLVKKYAGHVVFLECQKQTLQNRYSATRRRHPLAVDKSASVGISEEINLLAGLMKKADFLIDTTGFTLADLREKIISTFDLATKAQTTFQVVSFSFKKGLPAQADYVFDVRFLKNPHYVKKLKPKNGRDKAVQTYIASDPAFDMFFDNVTRLVEPLLPLHEKEGKNYVTFAFGCTGGKHRSVFLAEKFKVWLKKHKITVTLAHRDVAS